MAWITVRFDEALSAARREEVQRAASGAGAALTLHASERAGRTYGLLAVDGQKTAHALVAENGATAYDTAIIALAVYPAPPQALPALLDAFGGTGRPSGILECAPCGEGAIIEWDPARCSAALVMALIDVELRRFHGTRTAELLSPLPEAIVAQIAADGLRSPEITPERIIETLVDRVGLSSDA